MIKMSFFKANSPEVVIGMQLFSFNGVHCDCRRVILSVRSMHSFLNRFCLTSPVEQKRRETFRSWTKFEHPTLRSTVQLLNH